MNYSGFVAFALLSIQLAGSTEVTEGSCTCAVFAESVSNEPLIEHALPQNVSCDEAGSIKCLLLCIVLATGAKDEALGLICEIINRHAENLKVSVHTRACVGGEWRFSGLEVTEGICCHEGKETLCPARPSG